MTDIMAASFAFITLVMFIIAFRYMSMGWTASRELAAYRVRANEKWDGNVEVERRIVTKGVHPEMRDVKNGEELLVVKFGEQEPRDPLLTDLESRINELNEEDDGEEEGGLVVRV